MKHSLMSIPPLSCKSFARASIISSNTPLSTHCWNLLWQVWYGGYSFGRSRQRAPVFTTHKIPSSTSRLSRHGRPLPSLLSLPSGTRFFIFSHCFSLNFIPQNYQNHLWDHLEYTQQKRFERLIKRTDRSNEFSINDLVCSVGCFFGFLINNKYRWQITMTMICWTLCCP